MNPRDIIATIDMATLAELLEALEKHSCE